MYNPVPTRITCPNCKHEAIAEEFTQCEKNFHFYICGACSYEQSFAIRQDTLPTHCEQPMIPKSFIEFIVLRCPNPKCKHEYFWHFKTTSYI